MGRVRFDFENNLICHEEKCVVFPKYVIRLLSRLDYYAYDIDAFLDVVEKLRKMLETRSYDNLPEWVKHYVPKRYINALKNHLLWLYELR